MAKDSVGRIHPRPRARAIVGVRTWTDTPRCSFCLKGQTQVKKMIAGPGVFICEECVSLCSEIFEEEVPSWPWRRTDTEGTDPRSPSN